MSNAQHASSSAEYGTPELFVAASREVLGGIDCDPCTTEAINARYVRARRIFTREDSGLDDAASWGGTALINPPGSCEVLERPSLGGEVKRYRSECDPLCKRPISHRLGGKARPRTPPCTCRLVRRFWKRTVDQHRSGELTAAVWVGYSLEQLTSLQGLGFESPGDFLICIPERRISYLDPGNDLEAAKQPTHGSFFAYLGPKPGTFGAMFAQFGVVKP